MSDGISAGVPIYRQQLSNVLSLGSGRGDQFRKLKERSFYPAHNSAFLEVPWFFSVPSRHGPWTARVIPACQGQEQELSGGDGHKPGRQEFEHLMKVATRAYLPDTVVAPPRWEVFGARGVNEGGQ